MLLPGLGADPRLFGPQKRALSDLVSIHWPEAREGDTLSSYAARVATLLPRMDPLVLGGSSFGGMVALEMAAALRARAVILIGACRSPRALAPWIRAAGPLLRAAPLSLFRPRHWAMPLLAPIVGFSGRELSSLVWDMANRISPAFLKWGIDAILSWRPTPVTVPVRHVHGSADRIIPLRGVEPDRVIPGAGHLLTLTHADAVNEFLLEAVRVL